MISRAWFVVVSFLLLFLSPSIFAAGDVYILRSIDVPSLYKGSSIDALIRVENMKFGNSNYAAANAGTLFLTLRDDQGRIVSGFDAQPFPVSFGTTSTPSVDVVSVNIDPTTDLREGHTYSLSAVVQTYDGPGTTYDETVSGNNTGKQKFVVLKAPQTFQVPDLPFTVVLLSLLSVLGWLFVHAKR